MNAVHTRNPGPTPSPIPSPDTDPDPAPTAATGTVPAPGPGIVPTAAPGLVPAPDTGAGLVPGTASVPGFAPAPGIVPASVPGSVPSPAAGTPAAGTPAGEATPADQPAPAGRPAPAVADPGAGALSHEARNLQWLLRDFVGEVPGARSVAVVSSDGLLLLGFDAGPDAGPATGTKTGTGTDTYVGTGTGPAGAAPDGPPTQVGEARLDLAAVVSGLASLTVGAAKLMDGGRVRQTTVAMEGGLLVMMSISDGSLLGLHAAAGSDITVIAYHMALFVSRAGHVLTPVLRGELRHAMETAG